MNYECPECGSILEQEEATAYNPEETVTVFVCYNEECSNYDKIVDDVGYEE